MKLTVYERETIINYNMAEADASVYTHDKKLIARLEKLAVEYPEEFRLKDHSLNGDATYIFRKKYITIREPYSEARRRAARKRALNGHFQPPSRIPIPDPETKIWQTGQSTTL